MSNLLFRSSRSYSISNLHRLYKGLSQGGRRQLQMGIRTWLVVGCTYSYSCCFDLCLWRKNRLRKISSDKARRKLQILGCDKFCFYVTILKQCVYYKYFLRKRIREKVGVRNCLQRLTGKLLKKKLKIPLSCSNFQFQFLISNSIMSIP